MGIATKALPIKNPEKDIDKDVKGQQKKR